MGRRRRRLRRRFHVRARAYAQNFTQEELLKAIDTAHIHGRKLYLTVNTLLKNRELKGELIAYLTPYYEAGLDAVIVQDMGVFAVLKQEFPDFTFTPAPR